MYLVTKQKTEDLRMRGKKMLNLRQYSKELRILLRYSRKRVSDLEPHWSKYCKHCQELKPERTHHCSICKECVFHMDHHCRKSFASHPPISFAYILFDTAWANNCLGLHNQRYFLLFILYLFFAACFMMLTMIYVRREPEYKQNRGTHGFIYSLHFALSIVMFFFNLWNWQLCLLGNTSIEFWGKKTRVGGAIFT